MKTFYYIVWILLLSLSACGSRKSTVSKHQTHTKQISEDRRLNFIVIRSTDSLFKYSNHQLENVQLWDLQGHVTITSEGVKTDRAIIQSWSQATATSQSVESQNTEEQHIDNTQSTTYHSHSLQSKDKKTHRKPPVLFLILLLCAVIGGYGVYRKVKG